MDDMSFFNLHRKIFDSAIFQDPELFRLAVYLIGKARVKKGHVSIKTGRGMKIVELEVGQVIFGQKSFAKIFDCAERTAYNRLKTLKKLGFVATQNKTHYTLVTVINYGFYQNKEQKNENSCQPTDQPIADQVLTKCQPIATNNNDKKEKKENKYLTIAKELFEEYRNIAKKIKRNESFTNKIKNGFIKGLKSGITKEEFIDLFHDLENNEWYQGKNKNNKRYGIDNVFSKGRWENWEQKIIDKRDNVCTKKESENVVKTDFAKRQEEKIRKEMIEAGLING